MTQMSHAQDNASDWHEAPVFSIIIPVYNMSSYLEACIASVIEQHEQNFEIIAIDDGSTDNSFEILTMIALREPRLRIISKKNGGQGSARNLGMLNARGEYVLFVDSDDTVAQDLLSSILPHLSDPDLDVISFKVEFRNDTGRIVAKRGPARFSCSTGNTIFVDAMLDRNFLPIVWNKVYRKSLLEANSITFPELRAYEDSVFSRRVALHARKVLYIPNSLYFALTRSGSTSRGMSTLSFRLAAEVIALEKKMFCDGLTAENHKVTFRAHVARFFAYLMIQAAFRIDDPAERLACRVIADSAGYSNCAADRKALALLTSRARAQIFLANHPKLLRILAVIARYFNLVPY